MTRTSFSVILTSLLLLLTIRLAAPAAQAQTRSAFSIEYPEEVLEELTETKEPLSRETLTRLLADKGVVVYEGREPLKATLALFIIGAHGNARRRVGSHARQVGPSGSPFEPRQPVSSFLTGEELSKIWFKVEAVNEGHEEIQKPSGKDAWHVVRGQQTEPTPMEALEETLDRAARAMEKGDLGLFFVAMPADPELQRSATTAPVLFTVRSASGEKS